MRYALTLFVFVRSGLPDRQQQGDGRPATSARHRPERRIAVRYASPARCRARPGFGPEFLHVGAVAQPGFDLISQAGLLKLIDDALQIA